MMLFRLLHEQCDDHTTTTTNNNNNNCCCYYYSYNYYYNYSAAIKDYTDKAVDSVNIAVIDCVVSVG